MIERPFWRQRVTQAWQQAPIVWLSGVRRSGKTTLAKTLTTEPLRFVNCDVPTAEDMVSDPLVFFRSVGNAVVVFDEIHQLRDPARVLKIGADEFPHVRILATGSSTLAASRKFRDTLTGRKRGVHLLPVLWDELAAFGATIEQRLCRGGLPPALLTDDRQPVFYREWLDSFFARDIQRLFGFRDINRFNAFFEYILRQSGGLFETQSAARDLGIARPTVESHLRALQITHAAAVIRPFHGGGQQELTRQPKVYGFDTGMVAFARGWNPLRPDDLGVLWEHFVLEHLQAHRPDTPVHYWRDKARREIDFVVPRGREEVDVIECKWDPRAFDVSALRVFRAAYPQGRNFLVTPAGDPQYVRNAGGLDILVCTPTGLSN